MDISKYDFHDGSVIDIRQNENEILIFMESTEISDENMHDKVVLSEHGTLKGILHFERPMEIQINGNLVGRLQMLADTGGILNFEIDENRVRLFLEWMNYPPKGDIEEYSDIQIKAEKIFWENVPDLLDPFKSCNLEDSEIK